MSDYNKGTKHPCGQPGKRLNVLKRHLGSSKRTASPSLSSPGTPSHVARNPFMMDKIKNKKINVNRKGPLHVEIRAAILEFYDQIADVSTGPGNYNLADVLPGPLQDVGVGNKYDTKKQVIAELAEAGVKGKAHMKWSELQDRYCHGSAIANFVVPVISFTQHNEKPPIITNMVMISNPDDAARIARDHVKKMPDQALFLGAGVLSTTSDESWKEQRAHFVESFLPLTSLKKICHINIERAKWSMGQLGVLAEQSPDRIVDMNEFLLNETMAQLQLSLFGMQRDFVEETNIPLRRAFDAITAATGNTGGGDGRFLDTKKVVKHASYAAEWLARFLDNAEDTIGVSEAGVGSKCPMAQGPLSARIADSSDSMANAATFVFAGHDTTANTMTWLIFEASQRPEIQRKLQMESDAVFALAGDSGLDYDHLGPNLPFMTRCIMETLRKWPVVPNGTFREIGHDEYITGPNGQPVLLRKGTYVQIANWMRHRSTELWGEDVNEWNPYRDFTPEELGLTASNHPMAGYNPSTPRFSPFTYAPRDCMGKNFAQMEMRIILAFLFHSYHFELAGPSSKYDPQTFHGINRGTMGPERLDLPEGAPPECALTMRVTPRR